MLEAILDVGESGAVSGEKNELPISVHIAIDGDGDFTCTAEKVNGAESVACENALLDIESMA